MAQLSAMTLSQRPGDFAKQCGAFRRDADANHASILGRAFAYNQFALGQVVQHPGDVRRAGHEPASQFERGHGVGIRRPQQSQHVVLLRREIESAKQIVFECAQPIVGPPEIQVDFLFQRVEPAMGQCGYGHSGIIVV